MSLKDILWSYKDQIECNRCGVCCGTDCPAKNQNLCEAHPSILGAKEADNVRGEACGFTPVEITMYKMIACPQVVELIGRLGYVFDIRTNRYGVPKINFIRRQLRIT
jgi:hypothetical protein